jgi:GT2 family glycosyltransferase
MSNNKRTEVSIIIVNYNSSRLVLDSIASIIKYSADINYEIIIVDNNSAEGTDLIESKIAKYNYIKLLKLNKNIGFGRANNAGAKIAIGDHLFFLNPDTILINNAVKILSNFLSNHKYCGACGGNLLDKSLKPTRSFRRQFPSVFWFLEQMFFFHIPELIRYGENRFYNHLNKEIEVSYIVGADLMIKKKVYDEIGGFNPAFFMYYEEIELCFQVQKKGFKIISVPQALIQHLEGKSSSNVEFKSTQHYLSLNIFFKLTHSKISFYFFKLVKLIFILHRIIVFGFLGKKQKVKFWKIQCSLFFKDKH